MERARIVIIGAGICGAATAYFLARDGESDVVVLEAEDAYNRHSSGRSASYFVPMYETRLLAHLARIAEPFLASPPPGFTPHPLLDRRGAILATDAAHEATHRAEVATARELGIPVEEIDPARIAAHIPILRAPGLVAAALYPGAGAIDSNALSMAYMGHARRAGVRFALERRVTGVRSAARASPASTPMPGRSNATSSSTRRAPGPARSRHWPTPCPSAASRSVAT